MLNILLCDDEQIIHDSIRKTLNTLNCEYSIVEDCYSTMDVIKFLRNPDNIYNVDVLILDYYYNGNGKNGIEALPMIRKLSPSLPILILTTFDNTDSKFTEARKNFKIDYIQKPVSSSDLSFRLESIIDYMKEYDSLRKSLTDNGELLDIYSKENEEIRNSLLVKTFEVGSFISDMNEKLKNSISKDIKVMITEVFNNLDFSPVSLIEILDSKVFDKRVYKVLKAINDRENLANGFNKIPFNEWGIEKLYEYRYSGTGRIYVQELGGGQKPYVYCLDYNHKKHNG